jgi:hypothetical protein
VIKDEKIPATQLEGRKTFLVLGTSMLDARAPLDYGRIDGDATGCSQAPPCRLLREHGDWSRDQRLFGVAAVVSS